MAILEDISKLENRFMFRGKVYRLHFYCPEPYIDFIAEDGSIMGCGVNAPLLAEFAVISPKTQN